MRTKQDKFKKITKSDIRKSCLMGLL